MSGARSSDLVAVFGIGGLGYLALQYAKIAGATVVAVDVTAEKLDLAKQLGADHTVNACDESASAALQELGGADIAIVTAADARPLRDAFDSLRRHGRLVLVGLPAHNEFPLPVFQTVLKGISVIGSIVGTRLDLTEVFELHRAGRTRVVYETRRLDDANAAVDDVLHARIPARLVFDLTNP